MKKKAVTRVEMLEREEERVKELIEKGEAYTQCSKVFSELEYMKVDSYNFLTGWGKCRERSYMIAPSSIQSLKEIQARISNLEKILKH